MARFSGRNFGVQFKVNFTSKGRTSQSANTIIQNIARQKEAKAQKSLRRASAYARGVMRRSQRKGRTRYATITNNRTGSTRRATRKRVRTPSRPGRPPNYHTTGNAFGFKWIRFDKLNSYSYKIGPEYRRTPGSWRSRFRIDRMMERGGSGQILAPQAIPAGTSGWSLFNRINKHGQAWPMTFVAARYRARPFVAPAAEPTLKQFPTIYRSS